MSPASCYRFDEFLLEPREAKLSRGGEVLHLEPRALGVLAVLVRRSGELVRKDELLDEVWEGAVVTESALSRAVGRVRSALGDDASEPRFIETVPTFGYRFIAPVEIERASAGRTEAAAGPARRMPVGRFLLGAGLLVAVAVAAVLWAPSGDTRLERDLLAVVPFQNLTGQERMDEVGHRATEIAIRGIGDVRSVEFVSVALEAGAAGPGSSAAVLGEAVAAARAVGADTVFVGRYSGGESGLRFRADLVDVAGERVLAGVGPVAVLGHLDEPGMRALRQRIKGLVAAHFGLEMDIPISRYIQSLVGGPERWSKIPDYDAYVEFLRGVELFARDTDRARSHFLRATELDPGFAPSWLWAESMTRNTGDPIHRVIIERLDRQRERLSPYERYRLEYAKARTVGDLVEARRWAEASLEVHPGADDLRWGVEALSLDLNEPARVARNLSAWRPDAWFDLGVPPGTWYFRTLSAALHLLGRHEEELRQIHRARQIYPDDLGVRRFEVRALAALGRSGELQQVLTDALSVRASAGERVELVRTAAEELSAHGQPAVGRRVAEGALEWLERERPGRARLEQLALVRCRAERWEGARDALRELSELAPADIEYLGHLGATEARLGNVDEAREISRRLETRGDAGSERPEYWRGAIAAILGDTEEALLTIRGWISTASSVDRIQLHRDPHLRPLIGTQAFDELLAPDG